MFGSAQANGYGLATQFGASATGAASVGAGSPSARAYQNASSVNGTISWAPWTLVVLLLLYVGWAMVERHERIMEAVNPSNLALNLRNIVFIAFTAILGIVLLKLAFTKLTAWGIPGAAAVGQIIAAS